MCQLARLSCLSSTPLFLVWLLESPLPVGGRYLFSSAPFLIGHQGANHHPIVRKDFTVKSSLFIFLHWRNNLRPLENSFTSAKSELNLNLSTGNRTPGWGCSSVGSMCKALGLTSSTVETKGDSVRAFSTWGVEAGGPDIQGCLSTESVPGSSYFRQKIEGVGQWGGRKT